MVPTGFGRIGGAGKKALRRRTNDAVRRRLPFEKLEDRLPFSAAPIARPDAHYSTLVNTAMVITAYDHPLLENDFSPQGNALTVSIVDNPAHGTISGLNSSTGTFTFTPDSSYTGIDFFTYNVNDGTSDSQTVPVSISVGGAMGPQTNLAELPRETYDGNPRPTIPSWEPMTGALSLVQPLTPGLGLIYDSTTISHPIIVLETFVQPGSAVPTALSAQLTFNGSAGTNYGYNVSGLAAGDDLRFALQADATALSSGHYDYSITVAATVSGSPVSRTYSGAHDVVNRSSSSHPFGRGWHLVGLDSIVVDPDGVLLVKDNGDSYWFPEDGGGGYLGAEGDLSFSTLEENLDGSFTFTDKHGLVTNFSSAGLLTSREDLNGNTVTFAYSSGLLTEITDPFSRETSLTYTSGRLTSLTDFAGRTATLSYDGSDLASITEPDPDAAGALTSPGHRIRL